MTIRVDDLRRLTGIPVRVRLEDGTERAGLLRTELLSPQSLSVYLAEGGGAGATIYIDQIAGVWPIKQTT